MQKKISRIKAGIVVCAAAMFLLSSCQTFRKSGDPAYAATFQSYPNGLADIRLELKENMRFEYIMEILPEPGEMDPETPNEVLVFKGRWGNDDTHYLLRFRRRNQPDLYALVSPGYEPSTRVKVVDDRRIRFPLNDDEIVVWGIRCYKK